MKTEIFSFIDGEKISDSKVKEKLPQTFFNDDRLNFIGIYATKEFFFYSLPKKYIFTNFKDDVTLIYSLILRYNKSISSKNDKDTNLDQFPILEYIDIFNYFKKFGLYQSTSKSYNKNYKGKINWKKTILSKNSIYQDKSIIFIPPIFTENNSESTFLSYIMDYILFDGYNLLFKYIPKFPKYTKKYNKLKNDFKKSVIIKKLLKELKSQKKDFNKKLILNCINYLKWKANFNGNVRLYINNGNYLWQNMVHKFLNHYFNSHAYSIEKKYPDKLIFNKNNLLNWISEKKLNIINYDKNNLYIKIDHFCETKSNIYLFDSKYYSDNLELNYKQISYYYLTKDQFENQEIISALCIPSNNSNTFYIKKHINRFNIDGLIIFEILINVNWLIKLYLE
ncbi:MAG: hypothetical protein ACPKOI_00495 [Pleomorphochaeta sp.]